MPETPAAGICRMPDGGGDQIPSLERQKKAPPQRWMPPAWATVTPIGLAPSAYRPEEIAAKRGGLFFYDFEQNRVRLSPPDGIV